MGVDAKLTLPPGTAVSDVADVLGLAFGHSWHMEPLRMGGSSGSYLKVDGVTVEPTTQPTCASIVLNHPNGRRKHVLFQFEWWADGGEPGCVGFMERSTGEWLAAMSRVGEFFGGEVDWQDCDDKYVDESWPRRDRRPSDGQPWQDHQHAMSEVRPVEPELVESYEQHAAYYKVASR